MLDSNISESECNYGLNNSVSLVMFSSYQSFIHILIFLTKAKYVKHVISNQELMTPGKHCTTDLLHSSYNIHTSYSLLTKTDF